MAQASYDPKTQMYDDGRGGRYFGAQYAGMAPPPVAAQQPPAANPTAGSQQPPPSMPPPPVPESMSAASDGMPGRGGRVIGGAPVPEAASSGPQVEPTEPAMSGPVGESMEDPGAMSHMQPGAITSAGRYGPPPMPPGSGNTFGSTPPPAFGSNPNVISAARYGSNMPGSVSPQAPGTGIGGTGAMGGSYGQQPGQRRYNPSSQGNWGATSQQNGPTSTGPDHNSGSGFAPPDSKGQEMASANGSGNMSRYKAPQMPRSASTGSSQGGPQGL